MMELFKFNTLYILESLRDTDEKLGKELYDLLLQNKPTALNLELRQLKTVNEWNQVMREIKGSCKKGIIPILHLVVHGSTTGIGMNGDGKQFVPWANVYTDFQ